ncbi:MAG: DUF3877 family protein [Clostridia bacterium]|nr:DUF3877 family protein [Clostridia bacterium]
MNFEELQQNLIGLVKESQIKLGYSKTPINLYYPAEAICNLLDQELSISKLEDTLQEFTQYALHVLGQVSFSHKDDMFCITISEEGVEYVHEHVENNGFLEAFIDCMSDGHCSLEDVVAVFRQFSDHVTVEESESDEFDYLIYFTDGVPDSYRYCLHEEFGHMIYHRFTPKEFQKLGF